MLVIVCRYFLYKHLLFLIDPQLFIFFPKYPVKVTRDVIYEQPCPFPPRISLWSGCFFFEAVVRFEFLLTNISFHMLQNVDIFLKSTMYNSVRHFYYLLTLPLGVHRLSSTLTFIGGDSGLLKLAFHQISYFISQFRYRTVSVFLHFEK